MMDPRQRHSGVTNMTKGEEGFPPATAGMTDMSKDDDGPPTEAPPHFGRRVPVVWRSFGGDGKDDKRQNGFPPTAAGMTDMSNDNNGPPTGGRSGVTIRKYEI
jgi:hypothetical protein